MAARCYKMGTIVSLSLLLSFQFVGQVTSREFTLINNCAYTVWPGILTGAGRSPIDDSGFILEAGQTLSLPAPDNWSGRFWGRTGCTFLDSGTGGGKCSTGDCGGLLSCANVGGATPVTLAEFTLTPSSPPSDVNLDFYDVSLVDGFNIPLSVAAVAGSGDCRTAGCFSDLRDTCPSELSVEEDGRVVACKSACAAFGTSEYCCTGEYGSPQTCLPSVYSRMFKTVCPAAYSYAYDDATSIFTCTGADYHITFCSQN